MGLKEGDLVEYTGPENPYLTQGKGYEILNDQLMGYVVVKNDIGQFSMPAANWFSFPARPTDQGAAEYDEIMLSIGEPL